MHEMNKDTHDSKLCINCSARKLALFEPCTEKELEHRHYQPHQQTTLQNSEALFNEGDLDVKACTLQSGWALCFKLLPDGHRQILHIGLPGDFLGYRSNKTIPIDYSVISAGESTFCSFNDEQLKHIFSNNFAVTDRFFSMQDKSVRECRKNLTIIGQAKAKQKIAYFFCTILKKLEERGVSTKGSIDFPLMREDIADAIGITSVHLSRLSTELAKDKIIDCRHGKLTVLNREKLFQLQED